MSLAWFSARLGALNMYLDDDVYPPEQRLVPEYTDADSVDITRLGRYSVSSQKGDFGLAKLLDNHRGTFWQSDGMLPHYIDVQFAKTVKVSCVAIFTDRRVDESYTPLHIELSMGYGRYDLTKVDTYELRGRDGWEFLTLEQQGTVPEGGSEKPYIACSYLRVAVQRNYENGKDTRIKGLRILAPRPSTVTRTGRPRFPRV